LNLGLLTVENQGRKELSADQRESGERKSRPIAKGSHHLRGGNPYTMELGEGGARSKGVVGRGPSLRGNTKRFAIPLQD